MSEKHRDDENDLNSALSLALSMLEEIKRGGSFSAFDYHTNLEKIRAALAQSNSRLMNF